MLRAVIATALMLVASTTSGDEDRKYTHVEVLNLFHQIDEAHSEEMKELILENRELQRKVYVLSLRKDCA